MGKENGDHEVKRMEISWNLYAMRTMNIKI